MAIFGCLLTKTIDAATDGRIFFTIKTIHAIEYLRRFLGRRSIIKIDQLLSVNAATEHGKIETTFFNIEGAFAPFLGSLPLFHTSCQLFMMHLRPPRLNLAAQNLRHVFELSEKKWSAQFLLKIRKQASTWRPLSKDRGSEDKKVLHCLLDQLWIRALQRHHLYRLSVAVVKWREKFLKGPYCD